MLHSVLLLLFKSCYFSTAEIILQSPLYLDFICSFAWDAEDAVTVNVLTVELLPRVYFTSNFFIFSSFEDFGIQSVLLVN